MLSAMQSRVMVGLGRGNNRLVYTGSVKSVALDCWSVCSPMQYEFLACFQEANHGFLGCSIS